MLTKQTWLPRVASPPAALLLRPRFVAWDKHEKLLPGREVWLQLCCRCQHLHSRCNATPCAGVFQCPERPTLPLAPPPVQAFVASMSHGTSCRSGWGRGAAPASRMCMAACPSLELIASTLVHLPLPAGVRRVQVQDPAVQPVSVEELHSSLQAGRLMDVCACVHAGRGVQQGEPSRA